MFTDNIAVYLQGSPANMDKAQEVFKTFCCASGAKINQHKSAAIWASKKERTWEWGRDEGLKWIPTGKGTRYLGIEPKCSGSHSLAIRPILNTSGTPLGVNGLSERCALAHSGCFWVKDLWSLENKEWKGLSDLGVSHHASNRRCRDIITTSIPWRPNEYDNHIWVGNWIGTPTPGTGNPLDWVYLVFEHTRDKANVIEFKKIKFDNHIQATAQQTLIISMANYRTIIVLSQEKLGATLKVVRDPPALGKSPPYIGSLKRGSSRTSHGTPTNGTGNPTRL
ncbi:unnamed protein product [Sphagnum tenellum]